MAECFTVMRDEIENRIDPHFYRPEFIELEKELDKINCKKIIEICPNLKNGSTPKGGVFEETGIPYFRSQDFNLFEIEINQFINKKFHEQLNRSKVKSGDVLLAVVGATLGVVGYVPKNIKEGNINQNVVRIRVTDEQINPKFLVIILSSKIGQKLILRNSTIQTQAYLNNSQLGNIRVPIPPLSTQNQIVQLMDKAYSSKKQKETEAKQLSNSINDYVLDELGIKLPELKDKIIYVVSSKEVKNNRADPRYYKPSFKEFETELSKRKDIKLIGEISEYIGSGSTPKSGGNDYTNKENGIPFIRIVNLKNNTIVLDDVLYIKKSIHENMLKRTQLKGNDVLLSMAGTIGLSVIVPANIGGANINQAIARIVLKDKVSPFYLTAILNSKIGKIQTDRLSRPAVQSNINLEEIRALKIPLPPLSIQNKIAEEIKQRMQKAEQLQKEAKEELEKAKAEVEKIILG